MRKLLLFLAALPLFAQAPVASNISFAFTGFSTTTVIFDASGSFNDVHFAYAQAPGTCSSGTVLTLSMSGSGYSDYLITALPPGETLNVCLSLSDDSGTTWSAYSSAVTLALNSKPARPELPADPASVDTSYPDLSQGTCWSNAQPGSCVVVTPTPCMIGGTTGAAGTLQGEIDDATTNQKTGGTVILIPAGQTCNDSSLTFSNNANPFAPAMFPADGVSYNAALTANNQITMTNALSTYGISEGSGVRFGMQIYPSGSFGVKTDTNNVNGSTVAMPPLLFFVHATGADTFELYWPYTRIESVSVVSGQASITVPSILGQGGGTVGVLTGAEVVGSGIPAGTTVTSVTQGNGNYTIALSQSPTASATEALTFGGGDASWYSATRNMPVPLVSTSGYGLFWVYPRSLYWVDVRSCIPGKSCIASWNAATAYAIGGKSVSGGEVYTATTANTNEAPPNATYWTDSGSFLDLLNSFGPAPGSRISPAWAPNLATLEDPLFNGSHFIDLSSSYASHIRFDDLRIVYSRNDEVSSDPVPETHALIDVGEDTSDIIFNQILSDSSNYTVSNRTQWYMIPEGHETAIVNSYLEDPPSWAANYSDYPNDSGGSPSKYSGKPTFVTANSFTIAPLKVSYNTTTATLPATLTVSWTGTPDASITSPEILVYFDMSGNLNISAPQGVTVNSSAPATITYATISGNGSCDENDPIAPTDAHGRGTLAPIGCATLAADGTITSSSMIQGRIPGIMKGNTAYTEAGNAMYIQGGPGPFLFANNYYQETGIGFISSLEYWPIRNDYTIERNTFHFPMNYIATSHNQYGQAAGLPGLNLYVGGHEQPIEFKEGNRILIKGNIFDGGEYGQVSDGFADDMTASVSNPAYALPGPIQITTAGSEDTHIEYNTVEHFPNGLGCPFDYAGNYMHGASLRCEIDNNVMWDINGLVYGTAGTVGFGVGWAGKGTNIALNNSDEGAVIDHNTIYPSIGSQPYNIEVAWNTGKAIYPTITNNIFPYGTGATNRTTMFACNAIQSASAAFDCMGAAFKGNVLIPAFSGTAAYPANSAAQYSTSQMQTDLGSYATGNTLVSGTGDVLGTLQGVGWYGLKSFLAVPASSWSSDGTYTGVDLNLRLRSASAYNAVGTDGLQAGANIDKLEAAQGKVTLVGANQITSTSANITYVAPDSDACYVDYGYSDPTLITSFSRVSDGGGARVRNVPLIGLTSGKTYYYRVDCAVVQPTGSFATN